MKAYALIVAGGSGTRMQSQTPKQFLLLNGKPILMHTLEAFYRYSPSLPLIVVLPRTAIEHWRSLQASYHVQIPHALIAGGEHRTASVRKGLESIQDEEGLVAVHDGVRPLVSVEVIARSFQVAQQKGNAIAAVPLKDSVRKLTVQGESQAEDRTYYRIVQTPQTFQLAVLKRAYRQLPADVSLSDDASVVELYGEKIHLIDGEYRNIKVTTPEDLRMAEALLAKGSATA